MGPPPFAKLTLCPQQCELRTACSKRAGGRPRLVPRRPRTGGWALRWLAGSRRGSGALLAANALGSRQRRRQRGAKRPRGECAQRSRAERTDPSARVTAAAAAATPAASAADYCSTLRPGVVPSGRAVAQRPRRAPSQRREEPAVAVVPSPAAAAVAPAAAPLAAAPAAPHGS
ncbi:Protein of unknown function [Gryllus bimaculatus]|nr:Protein of unknown function [Gryllus bimaculatus]